MSEPVLFTTVTYLESNVWAALTIHPNRDALIALLKSQRMIVASTVTAAELLRAPAGKRERLGKTFCDLVTLPLLEPPLVLTEAAARAVVNCETEYEMRPSDQTRTIYAALCGDTDPNVQGVTEWIISMEEQIDAFIEQITPQTADPQPYTRTAIIERDDFLDLLTAFPTAVKLRLTRNAMRSLITESDLWMALAGALAHTITLATTHTPKKRHKKQRTGGADIWQLVYLGVVSVFVTNDTALLAAATNVSRLLQHPRCVVTPKDFLDGITSQAGSNVCKVCNCILPTTTGSHYNT